MTCSVFSFLKSSVVAVVGASKDQSKFGNKVLRALIETYGSKKTIIPGMHLIEGSDHLCCLSHVDLLKDVYQGSASSEMGQSHLHVI